MLDAIPTIGFSDPILSHLSSLRFYFNRIPMLKEGYEKTRPGLFKIANFRRWMVLAGGSELIDDIRRAPDDVLSVRETRNIFLQLKYLRCPLNPEDEYSTEIIRSKFSRDVASIFEQVRGELAMAIDDLIPTNGYEWVKVPFPETISRVICRTTNRIFVGVPLCRDRDYQNLNLAFAVHVIKFVKIISWFPEPLKPIASRMLSKLPSQIQQEIEFIRPMVQERFAKMEEYGEDWDDKPNDLLMWLMTEATGVERSVEGFARRLLVINFAAIHTTSATVTQVLYRLLTNPEYLEPLREEVDAVIREEGWTKAGMDKMYRIDSFLRETQRLDGIAVLPVTRLALRPFTFSNGVTVPAGTIVAIPASSTHTDERNHSNPDKFDGFRFAKLREIEGHTAATKYQSVSTSTEFLAFGLGRHPCPGRFFAVNEIKGLFAYIIATYDIKFEEGKSTPHGWYYIYGNRTPAPANLMFRARQK
ncbi:cytochrome P450 [Russula aff. rugulosa BPL654]|nr:cytochrome P450 [Russula aff. rugulosa BPL654]